MGFAVPKKKDELAGLYAELDSAHIKLAEFSASNRRILEKHEALKEEVELILAKIKGLAREKFKGKQSGVTRAYEGSLIRIEVTTKMQRIVNIEPLSRLAGADVFYRVVEQVVDMKKFDAEIEAGNLPRDIAEKCLTLKPMTPAVSVVRRTEDTDAAE